MQDLKILNIENTLTEKQLKEESQPRHKTAGRLTPEGRDVSGYPKH